jgi:NAD(P)-dependent dehydrogenase (short-subunit alcohol dehydrogenase family)
MGHVGLGRLRNKVAIVTGGGAGIGAAVARIFALEGAIVVIAELDRSSGEQTATDIRAANGRAHFIQTDVSKESDLRAMIEQAADMLEGVDILINNAGIGIGKNAEQSSSEDWDRIMTLNAKGTFLATKYVIPHMRARGGGSIVNIGSLFAIRGAPSYALYHASKGAIRQFTKSTALALAADGIRVNAVHPGLVKTPASTRDAAAQQFAAGNLGPMGRWGQPEEIAYGCVFLACEESSFVTGIDLSIDGGMSV